MLLRKQVSEERDEHIDLTPMVDVVFQLMTFMLFSIELTGGELNVPIAKHGVNVIEETSTLVWLQRPTTTGAEPRMFVGDSPDGQPVTIDEVKKAIGEGIRLGKKRVILQADGEVPHGVVLKTAAAVGEIEGVSLNIGVKEPD